MRNRTRSRSLSGSWISNITTPAYKGTTVTNKGPYASSVISSDIRDVVGNKRGYNPVTHYKLRDLTDANISLPLALSSDGSHTAQSSYVGYAFARGSATVPSPNVNIDFTSAVNELISDAQGEMPLGVNLLVNAIEFASLKTLVPSLLQGITSIHKSGLKRLGKRTAKDIAGSHLAYSFGLAPLINDFGALFDIRSKVSDRIDELERRNGRTVRLTKRTSPVSGSVSFAVTYGNSPATKFTEKGKVDCTGYGVVSADVNSFFVNDPSAQCKLWSSALGISTPLQTSWELVPFSFVIDWFLPVGNAFQRLESKLGLGETVRCLDISNWGFSEKREYSRSGVFSCESVTYPGWNLPVVGTCSNKWTTFTRSGGIPQTSIFSAPSGWSLSKSALSISLTIQKVVK